MSDFLRRIRDRRNQLSDQGGELSSSDFESAIPNDVISEGKAILHQITNGGGIEDRIKQRRAELQGQKVEGGDGMKVVATTEDGGRVLEDAQGRRSFTSPSYATTDPEQIAEIMKGAKPADVYRSGLNQDIIAEHPVASRAVKAVEGVPFVGSYVDEAVGAMAGDGARDAVRATSRAMDEERPKESLALGIGGGIAGAGAMALAALPSVASAAPSAPALKALYATGIGTAAGATEGAVYGAGDEDGGRANNAIEGAAIGGALGGGVAVVGTAASAAIKGYLRSVKKLDTKVIADEFGLPKSAAKAVKEALASEDMAQARRIIAEMGDEAFLADAGPASGAMLDAAAQTGGKALSITREAVEGRMTRMSTKLDQTLDLVLGKPMGTKAASRGVVQRTAAAREQAYQAAFQRPINYASDKGRAIESVLDRVPERTMRTAIQEANEAMAAEGLRNEQILAEVLEDGSVNFREMPNTIQLHQIKVALQSIAQRETDAMTGQITSAGLRAKKLSTSLRDALNEANPLYRRATKLGGDKIAEQNALEMGRKLFARNTTLETVEDFMGDADPAVRDAIKQGIRNHVQQSLSEVRAVISDPNVDARQAIALVKELSSDASRAKLSAAIGEQKAGILLRQVDQAGVALQLRAMVARNSATAGRQALQGQIKEMAKPSVFQSLGRGAPVQSAQRVLQVLTGSTDGAVQAEQKAVFDDIARALTQVRGKDAERALALVDAAMSGQPLKDQEARFVANLVAQVGGVGADTAGREMMAR